MLPQKARAEREESTGEGCGSRILTNGRGGTKSFKVWHQGRGRVARQEVEHNETGKTGWKTGCAEAEPTRGGMQPSTVDRVDGESQRW